MKILSLCRNPVRGCGTIIFVRQLHTLFKKKAGFFCGKRVLEWRMNHKLSYVIGYFAEMRQ
jgi:hypothetical protein